MATPSFVIVPDRYKAGKLYAQIPVDGTGDLSFTRVGDTATRVNPSGLIEPVLANIPRIDYTGGGCGKLLLEPQRTNLLTFSEQFNNAAYSKINGSVTANAAISPDGTMSADLLLDDAADGNLRQVVTTTSATHTQSIYCKPFGRSGFLLWNSSGYVDFDFNLVAVIDSASATGTITAVGNGWFRLTCTFSAVAGTPNINFTNRGTGLVNGVSGVYIYGAQLEAGSYATSYIPTLGASVTRSADSASKTGISSLIGQQEGTLFLDVNITKLVDSEAIGTINSGGYANNVTMQRVNATIQFVRNSATQSGASVVNSSAITTGRHKMAIAYKSGDTAFFLDGVQVSTTQTQTFTNGTLNVLSITGDAIGAILFSDSYNAAAIYTSRLSNTELASLTTL